MTIQNVVAGQDLQAAINAAQPGDVLNLEAGATFAQHLSLPNKNSDTPITIQSSAVANLPPDKRVTDAAHMAKIMAPAAHAGATHIMSALTFAPGAHKYNLIGLEVTHDPGFNTWAIMETGDDKQTTLAQVPHSIVLDRLFIHGHPLKESQRGIALQSANTEIKNCRISEIHGKGYDTQAIGCWNGPGPFKIINNYLEAAGENVMFGGSWAAIPNLVPSDIIFVRNHCRKPLSWYMHDPSFAGHHWSVKNLFELKNARRVLVEGNLFEGNWTDAQAGRAIVFTPRPSDSGTWAVIEDVDFKNNIVKDVGSGILILGADEAPAPTETRLRRIKVTNNLWLIEGSRFGSNGYFLTPINKAEDVTIEHNTAIQTGHIIGTDYAPNANFVYRNNLSRHNEYGIFGGGKSTGNPTISFYFPNAVVSHNVIAKEIKGGSSPSNHESAYPAGNFFPETLADVKFVDYAGGNFKLSDTSPYKGKGSDGKDIGVDMDALLTAQASTTVPTLPPTTPPPTPTPTPPSPTPTPSPTPGTPSPDGFKGTSIVDAQGAKWTIGANLATLRDGVHVGGGQGSEYKYLASVVYTLGTDKNWYKWKDAWSSVGAQEPGGTSPAPQPPTPTPVPTPAPAPAPLLRKVAQPSSEAKWNALLSQQKGEGYFLKRFLTGAFVEFEKIQ